MFALEGNIDAGLLRGTENELAERRVVTAQVKARVGLAVVHAGDDGLGLSQWLHSGRSSQAKSIAAHLAFTAGLTTVSTVAGVGLEIGALLATNTPHERSDTLACAVDALLVLNALLVAVATVVDVLGDINAAVGQSAPFGALGAGRTALTVKANQRGIGSVT